jgi:hypothetical protein
MKTEARSQAERDQADANAVLRHAFNGEPLDPEIARRVHERAEIVTEEIYHMRGLIDEETINALFRDDDDEP